MTTTAERTESSIFGIAGTSSKMETHIRFRANMPKCYGAKTIKGSNRPKGSNWKPAPTLEARPTLPTKCPSCLVPSLMAHSYSHDSLWDKFYTAAPPRQRRFVERYKSQQSLRALAERYGIN